jgi:hypothetical protein
LPVPTIAQSSPADYLLLHTALKYSFAHQPLSRHTYTEENAARERMSSELLRIDTVHRKRGERKVQDRRRPFNALAVPFSSTPHPKAQLCLPLFDIHVM